MPLCVCVTTHPSGALPSSCPFLAPTLLLLALGRFIHHHQHHSPFRAPWSSGLLLDIRPKSSFACRLIGWLIQVTSLPFQLSVCFTQHHSACNIGDGWIGFTHTQTPRRGTPPRIELPREIDLEKLKMRATAATTKNQNHSTFGDSTMRHCRLSTACSG